MIDIVFFGTIMHQCYKLPTATVTATATANSSGRVPLGRAFRCKSSLVPRCGLSATIAHAGAFCE